MANTFLENSIFFSSNKSLSNNSLIRKKFLNLFMTQVLPGFLGGFVLSFGFCGYVFCNV